MKNIFTAKCGHISFCNSMKLQSYAHENIHSWPHTEAAVLSGLQLLFQLPPWCQIWLWKQWLIAEIWLNEYFKISIQDLQHVTGKLEINLCLWLLRSWQQLFCFSKIYSNGINTVYIFSYTTQESFFFFSYQGIIYMVKFLSSIYLPVVCIQWISLFLSLFLPVVFFLILLCFLLC